MRMHPSVPAVLCAFFLSGATGAEPESPEFCRASQVCAAKLWQSLTFEMTSEAGGKPYVIHLSLPATPAPDAGYPVIYLLDAARAFGILQDIARFQELFFTPVVIVGVRYPDPFESNRRADFVPPADEAFHTFLVGKLRDEIAARVNIDRTRQALFGHSLSALFALNVALRNPESFDTYLVGDPSIQIGGYRILNALPLAAERDYPEPRRRILITRGTAAQDPEQDRFIKRLNIPLPKPAQPGDPVPLKLVEFVPMLQAVRGLETTYVEFPDETHNSMVPAHLGRGFRWTLLGWDPP